MTHATEIDAIKDTIKLIELLVTSLHGDKTFLSLGNEMIGADCVCAERVSPSQLSINGVVCVWLGGEPHELRVVQPLPLLRPAAVHGQRRQHVPPVGRGDGPAAADVRGPPGRRAVPGRVAGRGGPPLPVGRLRPRRPRLGHPHRPLRPDLRRPRLRRQQCPLPSVGRRLRHRLRRLHRTSLVC